MKLTIVGAGALGCLLAYALAPHADVALLSSRADHAAVLRARGISCERGGQVNRRTVRVITSPVEAPDSDIALITVKSGQTDWAAVQAAALLAADGLAVTLQNGLGNHEALAAVLGEGRAGQAITALGATLLGPDRVRQAGTGLTVVAAPPQRERAIALAALFAGAGLPAEVSADLEALVWGKLVVSCGINALSALLRVPNGVLAELPEARELLAALVAEAVVVAEVRGVQLPYADPLAHVLGVAATTAANRSSMLQDVLQGRPTEIGAINGALVREAARLGVAVPLNRMLVGLVTALDAGIPRRVS